EAETKAISQNWTQSNPIIMPGGTAPPMLKDVLAGTKSLKQYDDESPRFVGPVWDDSPFYFAIDRPYRMPGAIAERLVKWLVGPSMGMLALFAIFGKPRSKETNAGRMPALHYVASLIYFAALGFGFIAVELALLQNLTLLVGHPIYTLSALLLRPLAFGGRGAALSARLRTWRAGVAVAVVGPVQAIARARPAPGPAPLRL